MYRWAKNKSGDIVDIKNYKDSIEAKLDGPFRDTADLGLCLIPVLCDKRERHFRVHSDIRASSSSGGGMSMEHFVAQKVFEKRFQSSETFWVKYYDSSTKKNVTVDLKKYYDECIIEQSIQGLRADLLLRNSKGIAPDIMVEVWYKHRCEPQKIQLGLPIIEFKISSFADIYRKIVNWGLSEDSLKKNQYQVRFYNFRNGRYRFPWPESGDDSSKYVPYDQRCKKKQSAK